MPRSEKTCFLGLQTRYGSIQPAELQELAITVYLCKTATLKKTKKKNSRPIIP